MVKINEILKPIGIDEGQFHKIELSNGLFDTVRGDVDGILANGFKNEDNLKLSGILGDLLKMIPFSIKNLSVLYDLFASLEFDKTDDIDSLKTEFKELIWKKIESENRKFIEENMEELTELQIFFSLNEDFIKVGDHFGQLLKNPTVGNVEIFKSMAKISGITLLKEDIEGYFGKEMLVLLLSVKEEKNSEKERLEETLLRMQNNVKNPNLSGKIREKLKKRIQIIKEQLGEKLEVK